MKRTISEVMKLLEHRAPNGTAESWDNVGLLVGDPNAKTSGAVITIDLCEEAIDLAEKRGFKLIINHHPCIFPSSRGLSTITADSSSSALVFRAIQKNIAIIACHTNFDQSALEVPNEIAKRLGFEAKGRLHEHSREALLKLVVFVPESHSQAVKNAIFEAGAGQIGRYDCCGFETAGSGSFRGLEGTRPFLGKKGQTETVLEQRLETILPRGLERKVLKALKAAHPYEEIAYDLYPVEQAPLDAGLASGLGYGVWGDFAKPKSFPDVAKSVKGIFQVDGFFVTDPVPRSIRRVGFVAGKGAGFVDAARRVGCDLFITGEAGYHVVLSGKRRGISVIELGHRESEIFFAPTVNSWISELGLAGAVLKRPNQKIWT